MSLGPPSEAKMRAASIVRINPQRLHSSCGDKLLGIRVRFRFLDTTPVKGPTRALADTCCSLLRAGGGFLGVAWGRGEGDSVF